MKNKDKSKVISNRKIGFRLWSLEISYEVLTWVALMLTGSFYVGRAISMNQLLQLRLMIALAAEIVVLIVLKTIRMRREPSPIQKEPNIGVFETVFEVVKGLGTPRLAIKNYGDANAVNIRARCQFVPFTTKKMSEDGTYPQPPPFIGPYNAAANPPFTLRPDEIVGTAPSQPYPKKRTGDIASGREMLLTYYYAIYQDEGGNDYWFEYYSWFESASKRFKVCDTHNRHGKGKNDDEPKAIKAPTT